MHVCGVDTAAVMEVGEGGLEEDGCSCFFSHGMWGRDYVFNKQFSQTTSQDPDPGRGREIPKK